MLPAAAVLFAAGLVLEHLLHLPGWAAAVVFGAATVLAGSGVFWDGLKNLIKLNFTENVLMSIAVVLHG